MALAQRQAGVTQGYKEKAKFVERAGPTLLERVAKSLVANAREIRRFAADDIVYATIDTLYVMRYLKSHLGFRKRIHIEPLVTEREPQYQTGGLQVEPVRLLAKR